MSETFDSMELRAVASAMRVFAQRCDEILALLGEKRSLQSHDRAEIGDRYRTLKADLKKRRRSTGPCRVGASRLHGPKPASMILLCDEPP